MEFYIKVGHMIESNINKLSKKLEIVLEIFIWHISGGLLSIFSIGLTEAATSLKNFVIFYRNNVNVFKSHICQA
jgi:hypothetical protein